MVGWMDGRVLMGGKSRPSDGCQSRFKVGNVVWTLQSYDDGINYHRMKGMITKWAFDKYHIRQSEG